MASGEPRLCVTVALGNAQQHGLPTGYGGAVRGTCRKPLLDSRTMRRLTSEQQRTPGWDKNKVLVLHALGLYLAVLGSCSGSVLRGQCTVASQVP